MTATAQGDHHPEGPDADGGARTPLLIGGAGGFGRETVDAVADINRERPQWLLLGFLDDHPALLDTMVASLPVLGGIDEVTRHPEAMLVVTVGRPTDFFSRKRIVRRLNLPASRFATVVHPQASVAASAEVGCGSVLLATVVVTSGARVGDHVAVMPGCVLAHDCRVGDFATLACGVRLSGGVRVDEGAYIGAGALIREDRRVGAWSLVGMGAVVLDDVPPGEVWAGVPARRIRTLSVPEELKLAIV